MICFLHLSLNVIQLNFDLLWLFFAPFPKCRTSLQKLLRDSTSRKISFCKLASSANKSGIIIFGELVQLEAFLNNDIFEKHFISRVLIFLVQTLVLSSHLFKYMPNKKEQNVWFTDFFEVLQIWQQKNRPLNKRTIKQIYCGFSLEKIFGYFLCRIWELWIPFDKWICCFQSILAIGSNLSDQAFTFKLLASFVLIKSETSSSNTSKIFVSRKGPTRCNMVLLKSWF